jgi:diamine N-acetyltransferase
MSTPTITHATHADCDAISVLAAKTFAATFGYLYTLDNLNAHLTSQCSAAYFCAGLDAGDTLLMMKDGDQLIGYGKVGRVGLPVAPPIAAGAVEIHRVYIDLSYQGRGLGKELMVYMLSLPQVRLAPITYIGVWEENLRAQALYAQYGFKQVGRYLYHVGTQSDRELIMARQAPKYGS